MPSLIPGCEYDIFISYRHKDNKTGWVTEFVQHLKEELEATFKEDVSIYFDSNAHDGLLENHNVDKSLEGKIRSVIFIPILSQTYCDVKSFAWQHEFLAFNRITNNDQFGRDIKLKNGNVASRILPVRIHDLDPEDLKLIENELHGVLRPIDFIYKEPGVSLPLLPTDSPEKNTNKTKYRNQINKVAHAVKDVINAMTQPPTIEQPARARTVAADKKEIGSSKKVLLAATIGVISISAIFGTLKIIGKNTGDDTEVIDRSIAVLPFVDLSSARDQEYFSDGLSEELLNLLAKVPDLKVISRTSAFSFKGKNEDIRSIADKLDVAYVLEGSVRKSEDKIRITAQLIKASDGSHLWSDNYDREMKDIFKVQDEIADAVVEQLKLKLLASNRILPRESKPEVYNLWLQGKFYTNLGTTKDIEMGLELLLKGNQIDSTDARILAQLCVTYQTMSSLGNKTNREINDLQARARQMAEKAIAMDPNLPEGYSALGYTLVVYFDFETAEEVKRKALELDPANFFFINGMASLKNTLGKFDEAEALLKKSIELDPIHAYSFFALGNVYQAEGRYKEAADYYQKAISLTPRPSFFTQFANIQLLMGMPEKAMVEKEKIEDEFWKGYCTILCLWSLGRKTECDSMLKKFEKENADTGAFQIAEIYAWRNEGDKVFEWLERAFETRDPGLVEIKSSPFFKRYRNDPRYIEILKKVKLPI